MTRAGMSSDTIEVAAAEALGQALRRTPERPMQSPLHEESTWFGWAAVLLADIQRDGWTLSLAASPDPEGPSDAVDR